MQAMHDAGVEVNMISLAKREEEIYLSDREESVILPRNSLAIKLIIRIRDEAHRFAITFHRALRAKKMTESTLTQIEGIGKTKAKYLIIKFKKVENIEKATIEELKETQSIGEADAVNIKKFFENKGKKE